MPKRDHDNVSGMLLGDGGGGLGGMSPGNTLPFRYTDASIVTIPIPHKDLEASTVAAPASASPPAEQKKGSWFSRRQSSSKEKAKGGITSVKMTRGDYLKYWVKGEDGKYLDSVVEPEGGRAEWVRRQMEENRERGIQ